MIRHFKDKGAERLFKGERVADFRGIARQAEKRLRLLDAADTLDALRMLPSNRLEALGGNRKGQFSIRFNRRWWVCFEWRPDGAYEVEIVDYHWGANACRVKPYTPASSWRTSLPKSA